MGTNNLETKNDGDVISSNDPNQYKTALGVDILPRNSSGVPTANAGGLGSSTYPFKRANVTTGYFFPGMIIAAHSYNGTVEPGQGWYPCDGTIINQSNYNGVHSDTTDDWTEYVITSPLDGLYTPNLDDIYLVGAVETTQDGTGALTFVGQASHYLSVAAHIHSVPSHYHNLGSTGSASINQTVYKNGSSASIASALSTKNSGVYGYAVSDGAGGYSYITNTGLTTATDVNTGLYTGTGGTISQVHQPESLEVIYYIRII